MDFVEQKQELLPGLVSIMIPTYERPVFFEKALQSALSQTYSYYEVIVCDNSRDEETAVLMQKYRSNSHVRYVRNREARTKAENFMPFEHLARGEYLQWLMDDDILAPGKLSLMVRCFKKEPKVVLVTSRRGMIDAEDNYLGQRAQELQIDGLYGVYTGRELGNCMLEDYVNPIGEPSAALFRRRDLRNHYWRAESRGYRAISDVAMWLELLEKGECAVFREPLSLYRRHEAQEGQKDDVILLSRIEWFHLATEYYDRRIFLERWGSYTRLMNGLCKEYETVIWPERKRFSLCPNWERYLLCIWKMRGLLDNGPA